MVPLIRPTAPEYILARFPADDFSCYHWIEKPNELPVGARATGTIHRGGQQGGLSLTTEQSLQIYGILFVFTAMSVAVRQADFFVYQPSDRAALEGVMERY